MPYNLLWIIADQLRQDGLGCYGNRMIQTPHLDHLASEASVLENVQVANPLCMPSRATLISGLYPHQHGVWNNGVPLSDWVPTLANVFASYNYHTFAIGKLHFTPNAGPYVPGWADNRTGWQQGLFDAWSGPYFGFNEVALTLGHNFPGGHYGQYLHEKDPSLIDLFQRTNALEDHGTPESWVSSLNEEHHASWWIARRTVEALSRMQHEDRSFFGWVSFPDPHHPFVPPMPYAKLYDPVDVPLPVRRVGELDDKPEHFRRYFEGRMIHEGIGRQGFNPSAITEPQIREIIAHTYGQITLLDRAVGYILDYLRDSGFDDKTVIVFSSDHGELLGDHGLLFKGPFLYEPLTRIPCLIRVPGFGPQRNTTLFSSADLAPSLLSYIGLPLHKQCVVVCRKGCPCKFKKPVQPAVAPPHLNSWNKLITRVLSSLSVRRAQFLHEKPCGWIPWYLSIVPLTHCEYLCSADHDSGSQIEMDHHKDHRVLLLGIQRTMSGDAVQSVEILKSTAERLPMIDIQSALHPHWRDEVTHRKEAETDLTWILEAEGRCRTATRGLSSHY
ncbi:MAG: sulfatase-like hydrolase/transferase [Firmicutes bacterium]|nr:sulfatase-like hydrolase/transferase [Bacillota bacterium]